MRPRSYTVPLVALSVVLFGLLTAIAVVVGVRVGAAAAAPCVVGTWRVVSYEETIDLRPTFGSVLVTGGESTVLRLSTDGTGSTDYGPRTSYHGTSGGRSVELVLSGRLDFRYTASDDAVLAVSEVRAAPEARVLVDGVQAGDPVPLTSALGSMSYACSGDELVTRDSDRLLVVYRRA